MIKPGRDNLKPGIFPIGLLTADRHCLVVGGGRIGLRKTKMLLDAEATVTVVSPELHPDFKLLDGRIRHLPRLFQPTDVTGFFLVFAATSSRAVNEQVLNSCREQGIYACSTDGSWTMGDFVTPATIRHNGITIAVSTGGKSCRRAKMIRDSLQRHLEMVENADLMIIGISHQSLALREREQFHLTGQKMEETARMLMQVWGIHEFVLLNTCNRFEVQAIASVSDDVKRIVRHILGFEHLAEGAFYIKSGAAAFSHAALLVAGLLSQTPGEKHIVAQYKNALDQAVNQAWGGPMLRQWQAATLHVAKNIRRKVQPLLHNHEIEDLARLYLDQEQPDWPQARIAIIGTGMIGQALCRLLTTKAHNISWCYHRQPPQVPTEHQNQVRLIRIRELPTVIPDVELVICATTSSEHILTTKHARYFSGKRTLLIDLSSPRNIDPELGQTNKDIKIIDLDDLKHWYRREMADMDNVLTTASQAISNHEDLYKKLLNSFQGPNRS